MFIIENANTFEESVFSWQQYCSLSPSNQLQFTEMADLFISNSSAASNPPQFPQINEGVHGKKPEVIPINN